MAPLINLIEIPEYVENGQFVLRLAEGATRPDETLNDYVAAPSSTSVIAG